MISGLLDLRHVADFCSDPGQSFIISGDFGYPGGVNIRDHGNLILEPVWQPVLCFGIDILLERVKIFIELNVDHFCPGKAAEDLYHRKSSIKPVGPERKADRKYVTEPWRTLSDKIILS